MSAEEQLQLVLQFPLVTAGGNSCLQEFQPGRHCSPGHTEGAGLGIPSKPNLLVWEHPAGRCTHPSGALEKEVPHPGVPLPLLTSIPPQPEVPLALQGCSEVPGTGTLPAGQTP